MVSVRWTGVDGHSTMGLVGASAWEGSACVGTLGHLVVEYVAKRHNLKLTHIPYNTAAFADIIGLRGMKAVAAHGYEIEDDDHVHLPRLAVDFNQRSTGRLRRLIDELNCF